MKKYLSLYRTYKKDVLLPLFLLAGCGVMQVSCNKVLNALPDQAKVDGNAIVDQRSAEVALNGAYYRFVNTGENYTTGLPATRWANIHEQYPSSFAGNIIYYQGAYLGGENDFTSENPYGESMWVYYYTLVNAANGVIQGLEPLDASKIDPDRKKEILGEARFLRGYAHYGLLSYFAEFWDMSSPYGIMLRKEPVTVSNIAQARSPVKDSYDFILADVDEAIANAPAVQVNYYASKWAAMALKMRILINRGADGDYEEVIRLADAILTEGPYELEPDVVDLFRTKGLSSKEVILGTKAYANQISEIEAYYYRNASQYYSRDSLTSYLENDPRKDWMITVVGTDNTFTKYTGALAETKYAFRLTEVYLLKAEAIVRSGGSINDAKAIVKEIMSHAGVTDFSAIDGATDADRLLIEINKEFARNLVAEDGADWFSLLRLPFETVKKIKPTIAEKTRYISAVPLSEHEKNPAFGEQNPGYGW